MSRTVAVSIETMPKKSFATAVDWPGWSRSGKTQELALEALAASASRYAIVAREADEPFDAEGYDVLEQAEVGSGTEFGVPSSIGDLDRRPVSANEAKRLARIVEAPWTVLDRVTDSAPAELGKVRVAAAGTATRCTAMSSRPTRTTPARSGSRRSSRTRRIGRPSKPCAAR